MAEPASSAPPVVSVDDTTASSNQRPPLGASPGSLNVAPDAIGHRSPPGFVTISSPTGIGTAGSPMGGSVNRHLSLSVTSQSGMDPPLSASERRRRSTTASLTENFATFKRLFGARNELTLRRLEHERLMDAATSMYRMIETAIAEGTYMHSPTAPSTPNHFGQPAASSSSPKQATATAEAPATPAAPGPAAAAAAAAQVAADRRRPSGEPDDSTRLPGIRSSDSLTQDAGVGAPPSLRRDSAESPSIRRTSSALLDMTAPSLLTPAGPQGAGRDAMTPLSARSNVDARVINGSFYGSSMAGVGSAGAAGADELPPTRAGAGAPRDTDAAPAAAVGRPSHLTADAIRLATESDQRAQGAAANQSLIPGLRVGGASNDDSLSSARTNDSMEDTKFSRSVTSAGDDDGLFDAVNDYVLMDEIGRGQTGRVMRAVHGETGVMYAIKIIPRSLVVQQRRNGGASSPNAALLGATDNAVKFKREVKVLKGLKNKRVVRLLEVIDDPDEDQVFLVMPLLEKGPMLKFDDDRNCDVYTTETAAKYISDIAAGLQYLKRHRIVHRDLKPDNILLTDDDRCVLVDFGQSEWGGAKTDMTQARRDAIEEGGGGELVSSSGDDDDDDVESHHSGSSAGHGAWRGKQEGNNAGTPAFMAPEAINGSKADFPADVWSLGVIIYAMLYGKLPFRSRFGGARGQLDLFEKILHDEPEYSDEVEFLWNDLIQACLQKDASQRVALADIRRHPAMQSGGIALGARSSSSFASDMDRSFGGATPSEYELDEVTLPARRGKAADPTIAAANNQARATHLHPNATPPTTTTNLMASTGSSVAALTLPGAGASSKRAHGATVAGDTSTVASASRRSSGQAEPTSLSGSTVHSQQPGFDVTKNGGESPPLGADARVDTSPMGAAMPPTPMLGAARTAESPPPLPQGQGGGTQGSDRAQLYLASPIHRNMGGGAQQAKYRLSGSNSGGTGTTPLASPARPTIDAEHIAPLKLSDALSQQQQQHRR